MNEINRKKVVCNGLQALPDTRHNLEKTQIALSKGYGKGSEKKEENERKIKIDEVIMNR